MTTECDGSEIAMCDNHFIPIHEESSMTTITMQEAQARLPQLLEKLPTGAEFTITDNGTAVAQVKKTGDKPSRPPRKAGTAKGLLTIVKEDDDHLKDFAEYMG